MAEHPILDPDNIDLSMFKAFGFKKLNADEKFVCHGEYRPFLDDFFLKTEKLTGLQTITDSAFVFRKYNQDPYIVEYSIQSFGSTASKSKFMQFVTEAQKWGVHEIEGVLNNSEQSTIKFSI